MNIFLIIILAITITVISSIKFRPDHHQKEIREITTTGRKSKAILKFVEVYPGFELFANLVGLLFTILVACLSAMTWGVWAGCFIALVVVALAQLLGARLQTLTDQFILKQAGFLYKYFSWTGVLNSLVVQGEVSPIADTEELIQKLKQSEIDCRTQILIEKVIESETLPVAKVITKWSDIVKINFRDKLTPKRIDELFQSKQKIFPVIRNDENDVVGLIHWNEISTVGQSEKNLLATMNRNFTECDASTTVLDAMRAMAHEDTTVVVVRKNSKIVGLVSLIDLLHIQVPANEPAGKNTK